MGYVGATRDEFYSGQRQYRAKQQQKIVATCVLNEQSEAVVLLDFGLQKLSSWWELKAEEQMLPQAEKEGWKYLVFPLPPTFLLPLLLHIG